MSTKYCLGHKTARKLHHEIISHPNAYSLTLTLKPYYNSCPLFEQHRMMEQSMMALFNKLNRYYNKLLYTPEITKQHNIHYHVYFTLSSDIDHITFDQNMKKSRTKRGAIGPNYKLKKIDEITPELINYPFKDISRTNMYSNIKDCLFKPCHTYLTGKSAWKII